MGERNDRLGMISGIAFPILLVVGILFLAAVAPSTSNGSAAKVAQSWLNTISDKGDRTQALLVGFGLASSAFITTFLLSTKGRNVVPAWLAGFGWLAVPAGILGVLFITMVIVLLWYLALGIYGLRAPAPEPASAPA